MEIDFYLGDATAGERRSPYQRFALRRQQNAVN